MRRTYGQQFCPVARASEIFAERWTPIIIRNLLIGCQTFSEIEAGAPGIPRALLTQRLRLLERLGLLERLPNPGRRGSRYQLTEAGRELEPVCEALGNWGARWLEAAPAEMDPGVLLWAVSRFIDVEKLPKPRVVVRVDLTDHPTQPFWLVLEAPEPELCRSYPGYAEDLVITAETRTIALWHMGRLPFATGVARGLISVAGLPKLARAFPTWGGQSPFAHIPPVRVTPRVSSTAESAAE